jgi:hypothetical protein
LIDRKTQSLHFFKPGKKIFNPALVLEHHLYEKKIGEFMIRFDDIEAQETPGALPGVSHHRFLLWKHSSRIHEKS